MTSFASPLIGDVILLIVGMGAIVAVCLSLWKDHKQSGARIIIVLAGIFCGAIAISIAIYTIGRDISAMESVSETYEQACQLEAEGNYLYAYWTFSDLGEQFSSDNVKEAIERTYNPGNYAIGELYMEEGNYYAAMIAFSRVPEYRDAQLRSDECMILYLQQEHPDWFQ